MRRIESLGARAESQLEPQRVDPTYHLVFDDGSGLALTSDMESLRAQVEAIEQGKESIARAMRKQDLPLQRMLSQETLTVVADELVAYLLTLR